MPCSAFTSPKFTRNINPNICSNQWQRFCGRPSLSCRWQFVSPNDYIWNKTMFKGHCGTSCRSPVSKCIIVILLYQWSHRGKGCPYQQGVLVSDFWRILQLVLEILGKLMFEEAKEWDPLAAKERWEEKGSLTCTTGIHFIKVWTLQHFFTSDFWVKFFLDILDVHRNEG